MTVLDIIEAVNLSPFNFHLTIQAVPAQSKHHLNKGLLSDSVTLTSAFWGGDYQRVIYYLSKHYIVYSVCET